MTPWRGETNRPCKPRRIIVAPRRDICVTYVNEVFLRDATLHKATKLQLNATEHRASQIEEKKEEIFDNDSGITNPQKVISFIP